MRGHDCDPDCDDEQTSFSFHPEKKIATLDEGEDGEVINADK